MKTKSLLVLAICATCMALNAQNTNYFPLRIVVEEMSEPFPANAANMMENKLSQIMTKNGLTSMNADEPFVLTAFVTPTAKSVLPGPPMQVSEEFEINFYVADVQRQIVFASTSITTKAVGTTENRCYLDAIKNINPGNRNVGRFLDDAKSKVIKYYDDEADKMFNEARTLAQTKQYEAALSIVARFPSQSKRYNDALTVALEVYQMYIDHQCDINLQKARLAWVNDQHQAGAIAAAEYLGEIYPDAACYGDAMALYNEINAKIKEDWKFEMKQYQDGIDLQKQQIDAARQVGMAYGNHQQPQTTNVGFIR